MKYSKAPQGLQGKKKVRLTAKYAKEFRLTAKTQRRKVFFNGDSPLQLRSVIL